MNGVLCLPGPSNVTPIINGLPNRYPTSGDMCTLEVMDSCERQQRKGYARGNSKAKPGLPAPAKSPHKRKASPRKAVPAPDIDAITDTKRARVPTIRETQNRPVPPAHITKAHTLVSLKPDPAPSVTIKQQSILLKQSPSTSPTDGPKKTALFQPWLSNPTSEPQSTPPGPPDSPIDFSLPKKRCDYPGSRPVDLGSSGRCSVSPCTSSGSGSSAFMSPKSAMQVKDMQATSPSNRLAASGSSTVRGSLENSPNSALPVPIISQVSAIAPFLPPLFNLGGLPPAWPSVLTPPLNGNTFSFTPYLATALLSKAAADAAAVQQLTTLATKPPGSPILPGSQSPLTANSTSFPPKPPMVDDASLPIHCNPTFVGSEHSSDSHPASPFCSPERPLKSTGRNRRNYKNLTQQRRKEANARERTRVHVLANGFELLRKCLPSQAGEQKLSKLSILRIAIKYLLLLGAMSGEDFSLEQNNYSVEECIDILTDTIVHESKVKRN